LLLSKEKIMKRNTTTLLVGTRLVMAIALQTMAQAWADPMDMNDPGSNTQQGPIEPNFASYYEPWEFEVEPNIVSYELPLDPNRITNYGSMSGKLNLGPVKDLICQNGFVVIEHEFGYLDPSRSDIISAYTYMIDDGIAMYITADTLLHLYHIIFDESLKEIEERQFYSEIAVLTEMLLSDALRLYNQLEGDLKEAARRNAAYLAVAGQLIGSSSPVPEIVSSGFQANWPRLRLIVDSGGAPSLSMKKTAHSTGLAVTTAEAKS